MQVHKVMSPHAAENGVIAWNISTCENTEGLHHSTNDGGGIIRTHIRMNVQFHPINMLQHLLDFFTTNGQSLLIPCELLLCRLDEMIIHILISNNGNISKIHVLIKQSTYYVYVHSYHQHLLSIYLQLRIICIQIIAIFLYFLTA